MHSESARIESIFSWYPRSVHGFVPRTPSNAVTASRDRRPAEADVPPTRHQTRRAGPQAERCLEAPPSQADWGSHRARLLTCAQERPTVAFRAAMRAERAAASRHCGAVPACAPARPRALARVHAAPVPRRRDAAHACVRGARRPRRMSAPFTPWTRTPSAGGSNVTGGQT